MHHLEASGQPWQFAFRQQMCWILWTSRQLKLRFGESLINKESARTNRPDEFRKYVSIKIKEHYYQIELRWHSREPSQIIDKKGNMRGERASFLPCLFDPCVRDIDQRYLPASLRQPDGIASSAASQVKRTPSAGKALPNVV